MKKFKKISYIILIIIIIVLSLVIYSISSSDNNLNVKEKVLSQINYFESKILYIYNALNNIEFENFKLSINDISEKSKKSSETLSSAGNGDDSSSGGDSKSGSGEESKTNSQDSSNSSQEGQDSSQNTKKFSLDIKGILSNDNNINWNYIKNEVEILQASMSTFTLDLYEININNEDILNFSKEFDNLLIKIKNENKEETLKELTIIYSYFPKFIKNCDVSEEMQIIISTKLSIFKAYSLLDSNDWEQMQKYIQEAKTKFSRLLIDVNVNNKNQYTVNKCYILINELLNSVNIQDKEVFLIKYRNLLEDLNNL